MSLTVGQARAVASNLLQAVGLNWENADVTARAIMLADCWGVGSHGLLRLPYYLERSIAGGYPPTATMETVTDTGPVTVVITLDPSKFDVEGGTGAPRRLADLASRLQAAGGRLPGARRKLPDEINDDEVLNLDPAYPSECS